MPVGLIEHVGNETRFVITIAPLHLILSRDGPL